MSASSGSFRADIEGLRAVAVMSVVACHAWTGLLPGGLAGVDIFFVISGYLIGGHLLQSIDANRFSPLDFYVRRVRRLFPALATVLLCVWLVGAFVFKPTELRDLGQHMIASAVFANNVWLWWTSDPVGTGLLEKPLLHLWSLGAEEQFYLVLPAIFWMGLRHESRPMAWVVRLGVFSAIAMFAVSVLAPLHRLASFYLLPTRFWELAAGIAVAWWHLENKKTDVPDVRQSALGAERLLLSAAVLMVIALVARAPPNGETWDRVFAATGLVALGAAAVAALKPMRRHTLQSFVSRHSGALSIGGIALLILPMPFLTWAAWPGPQVIVPVMGAAIIVAVPPSALANRALAWRPLTWLGSISYPLYLWHWPLLVVYRYLYPDATWLGQCTPVALAVVLAWLTKVLIEDPVRFGSLLGRQVPSPGIPGIAGALGVAGIAGIVSVMANGFPAR